MNLKIGEFGLTCLRKERSKNEENEQSLQIWRDTNIHMMGAQEEKTVQRGQREYLKKYYKIFPNLMRNVNQHIQKAHKFQVG